MKLLPINLSQHYNQTPQNKLIRYERFETGQDTFTKTSSVSFKGAEENIYKKILNNPTLAEKFMGLIAAGAAALITAANIETSSEETNSGNIFTNLFAGLINQNKNADTEKETEQLREENKKLATELEELKAKLSKPEIEPEIKPETEPGIPVPQETKETAFVFPKKRGRLTKNQQDLKEVAERISLSPIFAEKLVEICQELLRKNSHKVGEDILPNDEIAKNLSNKLEKNSEDNTKIETIIDDYYEACVLQEQTPSADNTNNDSPAGQDKVSESPQIYKTEGKKLPGVKVVGKINIDNLQKGRRPRTKISETSLVTDPRSGGILKVVDAKSETLSFKLPGTVNRDMAKNLKLLIKNFEAYINKEYKESGVSLSKEEYNAHLPMWMHRKPVSSRVSEEEIIKEIKNHNQSTTSASPYEHLTKDMAVEIAGAINAVPKFSQFFTIHSAMRLLDRYVDFNSSISMEVQARYIVDKFFEIIHNALSRGVEIQKYSSGYFYGPRITISTECFDREAREIFGTFPITIGLCENQPDPSYYDKRKKDALITTIFSPGI